jgi:hypothetical protein
MPIENCPETPRAFGQIEQERGRLMRAKDLLRSTGLAILAAAPFASLAQNNPVRLTDEVLEASALGLPIDPATRVDPAQMPRGIGRRTLEPLGLSAEQLATARGHLLRGPSRGRFRHA